MSDNHLICFKCTKYWEAINSRNINNVKKQDVSVNGKFVGPKEYRYAANALD